MKIAKYKNVRICTYILVYACIYLYMHVYVHICTYTSIGRIVCIVRICTYITQQLWKLLSTKMYVYCCILLYSLVYTCIFFLLWPYCDRRITSFSSLLLSSIREVDLSSARLSMIAGMAGWPCCSWPGNWKSLVLHQFMGNDLAVRSSCAERVESSFDVAVVARKAQLRMKPVCWSRYLSGFTIYRCIRTNTTVIQINTYIYQRIRIRSTSAEENLPCSCKARFLHCYILSMDIDISNKPWSISPIQV